MASLNDDLKFTIRSMIEIMDKIMDIVEHTVEAMFNLRDFCEFSIALF